MQFQELADRWLADLRERVELGDLKPASLATFASRVKHVLPALGQHEVENVRNGVVKTFAENLSAKLGPKTTREVVALVKAILESHVNQDGDPILDLKWNNRFIFKSVRKIGKQHQPTVSADTLNAILRNHEIKVRDRVLIALGASTGMRVGELQALRIRGGKESTSWDGEASTIQVRQSVWGNQLQLPKTDSAIRQIDLSAEVNAMLISFTAGRRASDFIFRTKSGKPLRDNFINRRIAAANGVPGMHALRRFRATWADEHGCPRSLLACWLGHANSGAWESEARGVDSGGTTEIYIRSSENQKYRKQWVERIGTGLEITAVCQQVVVANVALRKQWATRAGLGFSPTA